MNSPRVEVGALTYASMAASSSSLHTVTRSPSSSSSVEGGGEGVRGEPHSGSVQRDSHSKEVGRGERPGTTWEITS